MSRRIPLTSEFAEEPSSLANQPVWTIQGDTSSQDFLPELLFYILSNLSWETVSQVRFVSKFWLLACAKIQCSVAYHANRCLQQMEMLTAKSLGPFLLTPQKEAQGILVVFDDYFQGIGVPGTHPGFTALLFERYSAENPEGFFHPSHFDPNPLALSRNATLLDSREEILRIQQNTRKVIAEFLAKWQQQIPPQHLSNGLERVMGLVQRLQVRYPKTIAWLLSMESSRPVPGLQGYALAPLSDEIRTGKKECDLYVLYIEFKNECIEYQHSGMKGPCEIREEAWGSSLPQSLPADEEGFRLFKSKLLKITSERNHTFSSVEVAKGYRELAFFLEQVAIFEEVLLEFTAFFLLTENHRLRLPDQNFFICQPTFKLPQRLSKTFYLNFYLPFSGCFQGLERTELILFHPVLLPYLSGTREEATPEEDAFLLGLFDGLWEKLPKILEANPVLYKRMSPELWIAVAKETSNYAAKILRDPRIYETFSSSQLCDFLIEHCNHPRELLEENSELLRNVLNRLDVLDLCRLRKDGFPSEKHNPVAGVIRQILLKKLEKFSEVPNTWESMERNALEGLSRYFNYHTFCNEEGSAHWRETIAAEMERRRTLAEATSKKEAALPIVLNRPSPVSRVLTFDGLPFAEKISQREQPQGVRDSQRRMSLDTSGFQKKDPQQNPVRESAVSRQGKISDQPPIPALVLENPLLRRSRDSFSDPESSSEEVRDVGRNKQSPSSVRRPAILEQSKTSTRQQKLPASRKRNSTGLVVEANDDLNDRLNREIQNLMDNFAKWRVENATEGCGFARFFKEAQGVSASRDSYLKLLALARDYEQPETKLRVLLRISKEISEEGLFFKNFFTSEMQTQVDAILSKHKTKAGAIRQKNEARRNKKEIRPFDLRTEMLDLCGYEFNLMSENDDIQTAKIYFKQCKNSVQYTVKNPSGEDVTDWIMESELGHSFGDPLTLEELNQYRDEILEIMSSRGDTHSGKDFASLRLSKAAPIVWPLKRLRTRPEREAQLGLLKEYASDLSIETDVLLGLLVSISNEIGASWTFDDEKEFHLLDSQMKKQVDEMLRRHCRQAKIKDYGDEFERERARCLSAYDEAQPHISYEYVG